MSPRVPDNWAAMAFASNLKEKSSEVMRRLKESLREFPAITWNDIYNRYSTKLRIEEDTITQSRGDERTSSRRPETEKGPIRIGTNLTWDQQDGIHVLNKRIRGTILYQEIEMWVHHPSLEKSEIRGMAMLIQRQRLVITVSMLALLSCERGKQTYMNNIQEPPKPPSPKRTVNVISGGEKVNGVTYMAAKKTSKVTITHKKQVHQVLEKDSITFDDADANGVMTPHNDTLTQADDKMVPKARTLSGFDNSSVVTKEEIVHTTFAGGVVKDTKFQVIDTDMAYNMILCRPWIYDMDVVSSTLHQVIKFPSQWGIRQISGD
ncbi:PREDICTED: uncharacterized protein LOC109241666 [Nicotiana attenuata]|uniref:uncharacterized protein LOC109241666 n=1 Tax=Nicotiana attenuata TaxID=49451 RepID=UPI000904AB78|nr:PREDICTED: uncharacterized protein LOC109241666 [Nicotiana attenuata]